MSRAMRNLTKSEEYRYRLIKAAQLPSQQSDDGILFYVECTAWCFLQTRFGLGVLSTDISAKLPRTLKKNKRRIHGSMNVHCEVFVRHVMLMYSILLERRSNEGLHSNFTLEQIATFERIQDTVQKGSIRLDSSQLKVFLSSYDSSSDDHANISLTVIRSTLQEGAESWFKELVLSFLNEKNEIHKLHSALASYGLGLVQGIDDHYRMYVALGSLLETWQVVAFGVLGYKDYKQWRHGPIAELIDLGDACLENMAVRGQINESDNFDLICHWDAQLSELRTRNFTLSQSILKHFFRELAYECFESLRHVTRGLCHGIAKRHRIPMVYDDVSRYDSGYSFAADNRNGLSWSFENFIEEASILQDFDVNSAEGKNILRLRESLASGDVNRSIVELLGDCDRLVGCVMILLFCSTNQAFTPSQLVNLSFCNHVHQRSLIFYQNELTLQAGPDSEPVRPSWLCAELLTQLILIVRPLQLRLVQLLHDKSNPPLKFERPYDTIVKELKTFLFAGLRGKFDLADVSLFINSATNAHLGHRCSPRAWTYALEVYISEAPVVDLNQHLGLSELRKELLELFGQNSFFSAPYDPVLRARKQDVSSGKLARSENWEEELFGANQSESEVNSHNQVIAPTSSNTLGEHISPSGKFGKTGQASDPANKAPSMDDEQPGLLSDNSPIFVSDQDDPTEQGLEEDEMFESATSSLSDPEIVVVDKAVASAKNVTDKSGSSTHLSNGGPEDSSAVRQERRIAEKRSYNDELGGSALKKKKQMDNQHPIPVSKGNDWFPLTEIADPSAKRRTSTSAEFHDERPVQKKRPSKVDREVGNLNARNESKNRIPFNAQNSGFTFHKLSFQEIKSTIDKLNSKSITLRPWNEMNDGAARQALNEARQYTISRINRDPKTPGRVRPLILDDFRKSSFESILIRLMLRDLKNDSIAVLMEDSKLRIPVLVIPVKYQKLSRSGGTLVLVPNELVARKTTTDYKSWEVKVSRVEEISSPDQAADGVLIGNYCQEEGLKSLEHKIHIYGPSMVRVIILEPLMAFINQPAGLVAMLSKLWSYSPQRIFLGEELPRYLERDLKVLNGGEKFEVKRYPVLRKWVHYAVFVDSYDVAISRMIAALRSDADSGFYQTLKQNRASRAVIYVANQRVAESLELKIREGFAREFGHGAQVCTVIDEDPKRRVVAIRSWCNNDEAPILIAPVDYFNEIETDRTHSFFFGELSSFSVFLKEADRLSRAADRLAGAGNPNTVYLSCYVHSRSSRNLVQGGTINGQKAGTTSDQEAADLYAYNKSICRRELIDRLCGIESFFHRRIHVCHKCDICERKFKPETPKGIDINSEFSRAEAKIMSLVWTTGCAANYKLHRFLCVGSHKVLLRPCDHLHTLRALKKDLLRMPLENRTDDDNQFIEGNLRRKNRGNECPECGMDMPVNDNGKPTPSYHIDRCALNDALPGCMVAVAHVIHVFETNRNHNPNAFLDVRSSLFPFWQCVYHVVNRLIVWKKERKLVIQAGKPCDIYQSMMEKQPDIHERPMVIAGFLVLEMLYSKSFFDTTSL